jgi:hypothetical protein
MRAKLELGVVFLSVQLWGQTGANVTTYHNDNARSGANMNETILTPANVAVRKFGKLFTLSVDGVVFAQPLYMSGLTVNGATHNVVLVATENNSIYAFDGDVGGAPLWQTNFNTGPTGVAVTPVSSADANCSDVNPTYGITSTPVIDPSTLILYTVAMTKEVSSTATSFHFRLHGVSLTNGVEVFPSVDIGASVPGTCGGANGTIVFNALAQHQRAALLLQNGVVYIGFGSHCDYGNFYGWMLGYNVANQQQVAAVNMAPDTKAAVSRCGGGIWQGGGGPAADTAGNIYVLTGNGAFNASKGGHSYGDSAVKFTPAADGSLTITDYFTPFNQQILSGRNLDLSGSGAAVVLPTQPGPNADLMVAAGKTGTIYLINRDRMGQFDPDTDQVVQSVPAAVGNGTEPYTPPVYLQGNVYFAATDDTVKRFVLQNGLLQPTPAASSAGKLGYLGGGLSISSAPDGSNAILWALAGLQLGVLHAYDATTLKVLYGSNLLKGGVDGFGPGVKFAIPTIANGKVYVGTQNGVAVYGLKGGSNTKK